MLDVQDMTADEYTAHFTPERAAQVRQAIENIASASVRNAKYGAEPIIAALLTTAYIAERHARQVLDSTPAIPMSEAAKAPYRVTIDVAEAVLLGTGSEPGQGNLRDAALRRLEFKLSA